MDFGAPRTRVKVCGITRVEDARAAVEAGADLLGFVMAESPRHVSPERAAEIFAAAPGAEGVAVMVRPSPEEALTLARRAGVPRIQLHGVDPAAWPRDFPLPVIFSVGVADASPEASAWPDRRHWMLCDTLRAGHWGGSGQSFPWAYVGAAGTAGTRMFTDHHGSVVVPAWAIPSDRFNASNSGKDRPRDFLGETR